MRSTTNRARAAAVVAGLAVATGLVTGTAQAEPEKKVTEKDVKAAFHRLEIANEKVNQLGVRIDETKDEVDDLDSEVRAQLVTYRKQRAVLGASIAQQQMRSPLGPSAELLSSDDAREFLDGLNAVQALNSTRANELRAFARTTRELENRREQLADRKRELRRDVEEARSKQAKLRRDHAALKEEMERLSAAEQARLAGGGSLTFTGDIDASGRTKKAIQFALSQLGDPYVYGGTGPDGWDCSGLMMKSWAAAGVSIPRVVGPQYNAIKHVSMGDLQPGDLVFYGDMSHDGMYLGGGKVVHAPRPGKSVEITTLSGFSKAGRVV
ncbi:MAG: NlpC/P60 family protein [Aeromicrobium erythreum]